MPRRVRFEGVERVFPDDVTDQEIQAALTGKPEIPATSGMAEEFFGGAGKSVARFVTGPYEAIQRRAPKESWLGRHPLPPAIREEPRTGWGQAGKTAADIGEFFIPAGWVGKGAKLIEAATVGRRAAPLLNVAGRAGLEAGAAAGVAGMQTGFDPKAMGQAGAMAGGVTAAGKTLAGVKPGRELRRLGGEFPKLGIEFNVPMTRAQQTQGPFRSMWESVVRRSLMGSGIFRKHDALVNRRLLEAGDQIAASISGTKLTTYEAGAYVKSALDDADAAAKTAYDDIVNKTVIPQAGKTGLDVTGNLQVTAKDLLDDLKKPTEFATQLRKVESVNTAIGVLEDFADPYRVVEGTTSPVLDRFGAAIQVPAQKVPKVLTFENAKLLRTLLFDLKASGEMTIGKGKIGQLNRALDDSMQAALVKSGRRDLANAFRKASDDYREFKGLFDNSVIQGIVKSDRPDTIIDVFLQEGTSKTGMDALGKMVKDPAKLDAIRRGLFERILAKGAVEGVLVGGKLERTLEDLGNPAVEAIFKGSPGLLGQVKRFSKLVDTMSLSVNLTRPMSAQAPTLLGLGQTGVAAGALGGGMVASALKQPSGVALAIATGTGAIYGPAVIAKLMTRPGATELLTQALKTPARSSAGISLTNKLAAVIGAEIGKGTVDISGAERYLPPPQGVTRRTAP